jgi:hypothetical protein
MIKKIRKWFWAWNDDKEEKFLEKMAADGYKLIDVQLGKYTFEETEKSTVRYQLDFKGMGGIKEEEYLQIFEDAGWECVDRLGSWYYFRKAYNEETPDISIFNDNGSRLEKYKRIIILLFVTGFPLYFQVFIVFPNLDREEFSYPKFYFFFGIFAIVLVGIHMAALIRLLIKIIKDNKSIRE